MCSKAFTKTKKFQTPKLLKPVTGESLAQINLQDLAQTKIKIKPRTERAGKILKRNWYQQH